MSEQVNEEPETGESSYEADVEAAQGDDDTDVAGGTAGAGMQSGDVGTTSHEADVQAGFDDDSGARNKPSGEHV